MKIAIIGSGNVAWHLAPALEDTGCQVVEVYSRNLKNAQSLAKKLYNARPKTDLDFDSSIATIFIIAVTDEAIEEVVEQIVLPKKSLVLHTSGSTNLTWFDNLFKIHHDLPVHTGVFYPIMTFSKSKAIDFRGIPFCIEATEKNSEKLLVKLAQQMSEIVYLVNSEERKTLHLSAVFACNFGNHLLALAKTMLDEADLEFDLLKPLIRETIEKALLAPHPAKVQTGPAVRGDKGIIQQQLAQLKNQPNLAKIYRILSESIQTSKNSFFENRL